VCDRELPIDELDLALMLPAGAVLGNTSGQPAA
jgi:hypothetical protein